MHLPWKEIDTVLLDMDGTLLDLNFDTHFWREHVPAAYAQLLQCSPDQAKEQLYPKFRSKEGSMDWYCVDYWSQELGLDIAAMKAQLRHLIAIRTHVIEFLQALQTTDKKVVLLTNAHRKSLDLKMEHTQLRDYFHEIICTHDLGYPKENPLFWPLLQRAMPFSLDKTLLIDDSVPILQSAKQYGIQHLITIHQPDSNMPPKPASEFHSLQSFDEIMPH